MKTSIICLGNKADLHETVHLNALRKDETSKIAVR